MNKAMKKMLEIPEKIWANCPNCNHSYNILDGSACPRCYGGKRK